MRAAPLEQLFPNCTSTYPFHRNQLLRHPTYTTKELVNFDYDVKLENEDDKDHVGGRPRGWVFELYSRLGRPGKRDAQVQKVCEPVAGRVRPLENSGV